MYRAMLIAAVLASAPARGGEVAPHQRKAVLTGERVVLDEPAPAGRDARWVQLSGPELVFRGGVARGGRASFDLTTNGVYRFVFMPDAGDRVTASRVRVIETERRAVHETLIAVPRRAAGGEKVTLSAEPEIVT